MFIVFEGLDGSGQTTQVNLLADFLRKKKKKVLVTKEPTLDSSVGKLIRRILDGKQKITSGKLQKLFAQDRKEHLEKIIKPALNKGKIVISDRYLFSSLAYGNLDLSLNWLLKINSHFILPDIIFFMKVKPKICLERIAKRGEKITLFEKEEKLNKVYQNYLKLSEIFGFKMINGEKTLQEVKKEINQALFKFSKWPK